MQAFSQKYTLVQFFEDVPEGTEFDWTDWPLHSTVADVFATDWSEAVLAERLTDLLCKRKYVSSVALQDEFFGPAKQTQVVLLEKNDELVKLHFDIVKLLEGGGFLPNNPEYVREGFLPHSTVQKTGRLNKGDVVKFDALSLIDMFPNADPYRRKVIKTIKIGN